jgi:predicted kinase
VKLILLNGPPGSGKSTLARRYADAHPPALALDVDRVRDMIGGRRVSPGEAGLLAREIALAAARTHLSAGHAVVVPQLLVRPGFAVDRSRATESGPRPFLAGFRQSLLAWLQGGHGPR